MLENISQSTDDGYEKYLKSPDLAYKALTQGLLNDEYIKLYKEQHPEDIAKIEAFLHPEISTESVKQKVEEDLKNIETYSEKITDIPDRQEKQIVELGGDPAIIEEKLKPEFNVLKSIRDSALNKFTKVAATLTALVTFNNVKSEDLNINKKDLEQVVTKSSKYPQLLERYVRDEKGELHFLGYEDKKGITINPEKENTTNRNDLTDLEKMAKTTKEDATEGYKEYISQLLKIQKNPQEYIENSAQEKFNELASPAGKIKLLDELQESQQLMENKFSSAYFWSQERKDNINKTVDLLRNGAWEPSLDSLRKEYQDEVKYMTDPEYSPDGIEGKLKLIFEDIQDQVQETKNDTIKNKESYVEYDKQLEWLNEIIKSPKYIQKALDEGLSLENIKQRIDNINKKDYNVTNSSMTYNHYNMESKDVTLQQFAEYPEEYQYVGVHEFGHESTDGVNEMSEYAKDLYKEAFRDNNFNPQEQLNIMTDKSLKKDDSSGLSLGVDFENYYSDPTELDARKKVTEYFMEQQGIKKYKETFTKEHYQKLLDLQKQGKLPNNVDQFIRFIRPEYIEQIMNTIADVSTDDQESINKINQT